MTRHVVVVVVVNAATCCYLFLQDAVYIELAGSHAHKEAGSAPEELRALMDMRHTVDVKMQQSQVSIFKARTPKCVLYLEEEKCPKLEAIRGGDLL